MRCESCGSDVRSVIQQKDGELWCRSCHLNAQDLHSAHGVKDDTIIGGMWIENLGPEPTFVGSHSERLRIAKSRGLREAVGYQDKSIAQGIDPKTLDNARILAERASTQGYVPEWRAQRMKNPFTGERIVVDYDAKNPELRSTVLPLRSKDLA